MLEVTLNIFKISDVKMFTALHSLMDWSLITSRGGVQNGKIAGPKLFAPPLQDRVKLFSPPPF